MVDLSRLEELRRRVRLDPASIAFGQLAEELRRAGSFDESVAVCRDGLALHPDYVSARVTLGRALLELNEIESALRELQSVVQTAPDNLIAIRTLAQFHHRRGELSDALGYYRNALAVVGHDRELETTVAALDAEVERARQPGPPAAVGPATLVPVDSKPAAPSTAPSSDREHAERTIDALQQMLDSLHGPRTDGGT